MDTPKAITEFEGKGDAIAYYLSGHHDPLEFATAVIKEYETEEVQFEPPAQMVLKVKHTYYRKIPSGIAGVIILRNAFFYSRSSFPVTVYEC